MSARAGVRSVSQEQVHAAYSMGAWKWQVIWHVVIPAAMPEILTAMRISIGFGWTTLVAAEMVAATHGLGQMALNASNFLRTDIVVMGIVVIGAIAYLFALLMRYVERWWSLGRARSERDLRALRAIASSPGATAAPLRKPVIGRG